MSTLNLAYVPSGNMVYSTAIVAMAVGVRHSLLVPSELIKRKVWFNIFQTGGTPWFDAEINFYRNGSLITQLPFKRLANGSFTVGINAQQAGASAMEKFVFYDSVSDGCEASPYELTVDCDQIDLNVLSTVSGTTKNYSFLACWSQNLTPPL